MHTKIISILATVLFSSACGSNTDTIDPDASVITADPSTFKLVFRTQIVSGDFANGSQQTAADIADSICQLEADGAQFGGTFRAWLSDGRSSPDDRFEHSSTPYAKFIGGIDEGRSEVIAADWDELVSGQLRAEIDVDAFGATSTFDGPIWTGTLTNGKSDGQSHCNDWTSEEGQAASGSDAKIDSQWTAGPLRSCMERGGLYCFQQ